MKLPLSGRTLAAGILVVGVAALIGTTVYWFASRSKSQSPLAAAEVRLNAASQAFTSAERQCLTDRSAAIRCLHPKEQAWGTAFDELASALAATRFSGSQQGEADALAGDARRTAQALFAASRANGAAAHSDAFVRAQGMLRQFQVDAARLFGNSP
jgi:hypothetical protein